jgi:hypothetical protein
LEMGAMDGTMGNYLSDGEYLAPDNSDYTPPDNYNEPPATRDALYGGLESEEPQ